MSCLSLLFCLWLSGPLSLSLSLSFPLSMLPQRTILAVLLPQRLHLLLREALFLCYLEMLERLCRRLGVCILHASLKILR
jgi:hypothetical protein